MNHNDALTTSHLDDRVSVYSCNGSRRQQVAQLLCGKTMDMAVENILVS
jgi:hypothetical protein